MKVAIETHGCRLNQADGDGMARLVTDAGHTLVSDPLEADAFVLNGCTITAQADADARRRVRAVQRDAPGIRVVLTGCFANAHGDGGLEGVHAVLGNLEKDGIADVLRPEANGLRSVQSLVRHRGRRRPEIVRPPMPELPTAGTVRRARGYLKVQDGCNYQCSFCIVPQVRGRSRSLTIDESRVRLRDLVDAGHCEIGVVGIHLGTWGWDHGARVTGLAGLVRGLLPRLQTQTGRARLRLGSIDPHEVDDALLDLIASEPDVCSHLHLPVQSADDSVLTAMRRAHRAADLERLMPRIREKIADVAVGTDLIVGFPGETDDAFDRTLESIDALGIAYAHVFRFSARPGTDAATMRDRPSAAVAKARSAALRERCDRAWRRFRETQLGAERDAILVRTRGADRLVALTDNFVRVQIEAPVELFGRRARVRIETIDGQYTAGSLVSAAPDARTPGEAVRAREDADARGLMVPLV